MADESNTGRSQFPAERVMHKLTRELGVSLSDLQEANAALQEENTRLRHLVVENIAMNCDTFIALRDMVQRGDIAAAQEWLNKLASIVDQLADAKRWADDGAPGSADA